MKSQKKYKLYDESDFNSEQLIQKKTSLIIKQLILCHQEYFIENLW